MKAKRKFGNKRKLINTGTVGKFLRATTGDGNYQNWEDDMLDDAVTALQDRGIKVDTIDALNDFLLELGVEEAEKLVLAVNDLVEIINN